MSLYQRILTLFKKQPQITTSFQLLSDLHLEVGQQYTSFSIPPTASYLILAGDIGRLIDYDNYLTFLRIQTSYFQKVFIVLGNNEFYGISYPTGLSTAEKFRIFSEWYVVRAPTSTKLVNEAVLKSKVVLLNRTRFDGPETDVTILGCTLWSRIQEDKKGMIAAVVQDFSRIEEWNVERHIEEFEREWEWLRSQISEIRGLSDREKEKKRKILVVTHHAPCVKGTAKKKHEGSVLNSAFSTELLGEGEKGGWRDVSVWAFGHTHFSTEFEKRGVRVVGR